MDCSGLRQSRLRLPKEPRNPKFPVSSEIPRDSRRRGFKPCPGFSPSVDRNTIPRRVPGVQGERERGAAAGAKLFRGIPSSARGPSVPTTISCTLLTNAPGTEPGTKALQSLCHAQTQPSPPTTALQGAEAFSKAFGEAPPTLPGSKGSGINVRATGGEQQPDTPLEMGFEQLDAEFWGSGDVGKEQGSLTSKSGLFHSSIPHSWSTGTIPVPVRGAGENPAADVGI